MKSFKSAVEEFLTDAAAWLPEEASPATVALQHTAEELDKKITGNLLSQYRLLYTGILKMKPEDSTEDGDELDDLIPD